MNDRAPEQYHPPEDSLSQAVEHVYGVTVAPFILQEYFSKHDPMPDNSQLIRVVLPDTRERTFILGGSFSNRQEVGLAFGLLAQSEQIPEIHEEVLTNLKKEQTFKGKTVVSVGGIWGELFAQFGAQCISIDPIMDEISRVAPPFSNELIQRISLPLTSETVSEIQNHLGHPDIVLSCRVLAQNSGLQSSGLYESQEQAEYQFGKALVQICPPGSTLIVGGEKYQLIHAFDKNPLLQQSPELSIKKIFETSYPQTTNDKTIVYLRQ